MINKEGYSYYNNIDMEEAKKAILEKRMAHAKRIGLNTRKSKKKKSKYKSHKSGIEAYPFVHGYVHIISTPMK